MGGPAERVAERSPRVEAAVIQQRCWVAGRAVVLVRGQVLCSRDWSPRAPQQARRAPATQGGESARRCADGPARTVHGPPQAGRDRHGPLGRRSFANQSSRRLGDVMHRNPERKRTQRPRVAVDHQAEPAEDQNEQPPGESDHEPLRCAGCNARPLFSSANSRSRCCSSCHAARPSRICSCTACGT